jgi:hypothetical protein
VIDVVLARLALLRRRSEQQSLEVFIQQNGLCRQAEKQFDEAARSASRHLNEARARERELIGSLAARPVSQAAIIRTQTELDRVALETARLRAVAANAQARLLDQRSTRAKARENFRLRQRSAAKLDFVLKRQAERKSRWEAALTETDDEDRGTAAASSLP